jgi:hypothetical protein
VRAVRWRLLIADARQRFEFPGGGLLTQGAINTLPFDDETGKDKNGRPLTSNKELADMCLAAMGAGISAPASMTKQTALKNIEWRGTHAATELGRILDELGYVFAVAQDGSFRIFKMGEGSGSEEFSAASQVVPGGITLPGGDRRGKTVVFCSAPTPVANTVTVKGIKDEAWEFVAEDSDGKWRWIGDLKILNGKAAPDIVRNNFQDIAEKYRARARTQFYRCVRLDPAKWNYAPVYRQLLLKGKPASTPEFDARVAVADQGGRIYVTPAAPVRLHVLAIVDAGPAGPVVIFNERIGKTTTNANLDKKSVNPDADFQELDSVQDFQGKVTIEAQENVGGVYRPTYFFAGYIKGPGGIVQLPQDAAKAAMTSADTLIVARPELQLLQEDGTETNRQELEDACHALADRWLANSDTLAKVHLLVGFARVNLSGKISSISITQSPPMTKVKEMTWFRPAGTYLSEVKDRAGEGGVGGGSAQAYQGQARARASGSPRASRGCSSRRAGAAGGDARRGRADRDPRCQPEGRERGRVVQGEVGQRGGEDHGGAAGEAEAAPGGDEGRGSGGRVPLQRAGVEPPLAAEDDAGRQHGGGGRLGGRGGGDGQRDRRGGVRPVAPARNVPREADEGGRGQRVEDDAGDVHVQGRVDERGEAGGQPRARPQPAEGDVRSGDDRAGVLRPGGGAAAARRVRGADDGRVHVIFTPSRPRIVTPGVIVPTRRRVAPRPPARTPRRWRPRWCPVHGWGPPPAPVSMASGDQLVNDAGDEFVDADGNEIPSDAAGDGCCCGCSACPAPPPACTSCGTGGCPATVHVAIKSATAAGGSTVIGGRTYTLDATAFAGNTYVLDYDPITSLCQWTKDIAGLKVLEDGVDVTTRNRMAYARPGGRLCGLLTVGVSFLRNGTTADGFDAVFYSDAVIGTGEPGSNCPASTDNSRCCKTADFVNRAGDGGESWTYLVDGGFVATPC